MLQREERCSLTHVACSGEDGDREAAELLSSEGGFSVDKHQPCQLRAARGILLEGFFLADSTTKRLGRPLNVPINLLLPKASRHHLSWHGHPVPHPS